MPVLSAIDLSVLLLVHSLLMSSIHVALLCASLIHPVSCLLFSMVGRNYAVLCPPIMNIIVLPVDLNVEHIQVLQLVYEHFGSDQMKIFQSCLCPSLLEVAQHRYTPPS